MGGEDSTQKPLLPRENDHERQLEEKTQEQASTSENFDWLGRPASQRKSGGKKTLFFSLGNICLWYTAYFGVYFNMVLFFRSVLGEGSGAAANDTNNWLGSMFLSSLLGAFVAESYLGRLWACALFQALALLGMILMTLATTLLVSGDSSKGIQVFFYLSIYLISIGCGGFQPTLQSLGADQFDAEGDKAAFFTRYLVLNNLGIALGDTVIVYVVTAKGWVFGFCICTAVGAVGLALFLLGFPLFRQYKHKGNPFTRALQVVVAATRKWKVKAPTDCNALYEEGLDEGRIVLKHSDSLRWLDKAATPSPSDGSGGRDGWKLSTVTEVEEMKTVLRLLPVWASSIFFNTVYSQAGTLLVEEGETMDTIIAGSLIMEPATMNMFNILAVVLLPPLYNTAVVPVARRITGLPRGLSPLHRTGLGYVFCIVSLSLAATLEAVRLRRDHAGLSPPSIFWQVPEFVLLGTAQFLAGIGQLEFFYTYSPPTLRSLGSSFCLTCIALGDYLSSVLVSVVTLASARGGRAGWIPRDLDDGHLDYFFWLLAGLAFLNLLFFIACATSFTRQRFRMMLPSESATSPLSNSTQPSFLLEGDTLEPQAT